MLDRLNYSTQTRGQDVRQTSKPTQPVLVSVSHDFQQFQLRSLDGDSMLCSNELGSCTMLCVVVGAKLFLLYAFCSTIYTQRASAAGVKQTVSLFGGICRVEACLVATG